MDKAVFESIKLAVTNAATLLAERNSDNFLQVKA